MNRRQDASRIMSKFQGERLQGKPMTVIIKKSIRWKLYNCANYLNILDIHNFELYIM